MAQLVVVNCRRTPYLVDSVGHVLGGGERGTVDSGEPRVQAGLASGRLIAVADSRPSQPAVESAVAA